MGWGSLGFAAGAASVGTLWTSVGSRVVPEPASSFQPQVVLPSRSAEPPVQVVLDDSSQAAPAQTDRRYEPGPPVETVADSHSEVERDVATRPEQTARQVPVVEPKPSARLLINLNTASLAELDLLPGIGPALADRIVTERERGGRFVSLRDLQRVSGIGPRTAEKLEGLVVFE